MWHGIVFHIEGPAKAKALSPFFVLVGGTTRRVSSVVRCRTSDWSLWSQMYPSIYLIGPYSRHLLGSLYITTSN